MSINNTVIELLTHIITYVDKTNAKIDELNTYIKTINSHNQVLCRTVEEQNAKIESLQQYINTLEERHKSLHSDVYDLIVDNDAEHNRFTSRINSINTVLNGNGLILNDNGKILCPYLFGRQIDEYKRSITQLDTRVWDVSHKTLLCWTFYNCKNLTVIDISTWDTLKIQSFSHMFSGCESLQQIIGIERIDTSNAISIDDMFGDCKMLKSLDLSKWNVFNVTCIDNMFRNCISLEHLDLSNWTTSQVVKNGVLQSNLKKNTDIPVQSGCKITLFYGCEKLKDLILSEHLKECVRLGYIEIPAYVTVK